MASRGGFNASGLIWKRVTRFVVGLIGVAFFLCRLESDLPIR
jgi:hypothetical protein